MKNKKIPNVKMGHRQSNEQQALSQQANLHQHKKRHKADKWSGGGGSIGAGGKKGRPLNGWERGDIARDANLNNSSIPLRVKSAKRVKRSLRRTHPQS